MKRHSRRQASILVRTPGDPLLLAASVRQSLGEIDPRLPIDELKPAEQIYDRYFKGSRALIVLFALFAFFALGMAALGTYGEKPSKTLCPLCLCGSPPLELKSALDRRVSSCLDTTSASLCASCAARLDSSW